MSVASLLRISCLFLGLATCAAGSIARAATETLTESSNKYAKSAAEMLQKGDLRGAEIQLRNAIREEPQNGDLRLRLAQVFLALNNPLGAEAEALAARQRHMDDDRVAPVLAEALLRQGQFGKLLQSVPAGNRQPAAESMVRLARGLATLEQGDRGAAGTMLRESEKLDPEAVGPKTALVFWMLVGKDLVGAQREAATALALAPHSSDALDAMGSVLMAANSREEARKDFDEAIARDPNNLRARGHRANLLVISDQFADAQKDLDFLFKVGPGNLTATYLQALLYAKQRKYKEANETLQKARGAFGRLPAAYYLDGMVKFFLGQYETAEESLTRYVSRVPDQPKAYEILGSIALQRGNFEKAMSDANTALKIAPGDPGALSLLGRVDMAVDKPDDALAAFEAALRSAPDAAELQTDAAISRLRTGDIGGGLAQLENTFDASPKANGAGPPLIIMALRAGRIGTASAAAEELAKRAPDNVLAQNLLGVTRFAKRDFSGAESVFRAIIEKHPELASVRRNLAQVYVVMNRIDDARALFREAIDKNPGDTASFIALADIEIQQKNIKEAERLLLQARATHSDDPAPGMRLIELYQSQKQWNDAISMARMMEGQFSNNVGFLDLYGRVLVASGDVQNGLAILRKALDIAPKSTALLQIYARALLAAKDTKGAEEALAKAAALRPGDEGLKLALIETAYAAGGIEAAKTAAHDVAFGGEPNPLAAIMLAEALARSGKLDEAIDTMEKVPPENLNGRAVRTLANLYFAKGVSDRMLVLLKGWLDKNPNDDATRGVMATTLLRLGRYDEALAEYERLANDQKEDFAVLNNLAWIYSIKDDPRALEIAETAYKISGGAAPVADTLGWILLKKGDLGSAKPYLSSAGAQLPNNPDVQYHLATLLYREGKSPEARAILEKITAPQAKFDSKADAMKLLEEIKGG